MNHNDYVTLPVTEEPYKGQSATGLVWVGPIIATEEQASNWDDCIRQEFAYAMDRKRRRLDGDGRQFRIEGGEVTVQKRTNPLDMVSFSYRSLALVTLASPHQATLGDYVHISAIHTPGGSDTGRVGEMTFRRDRAYGYEAWCRIE